jgi:hypothetical protein
VLLGRPTEEIDASQKAAQNAHFYRFSLRAVKSEQDVQFGAPQSTRLKTRADLADLSSRATASIDAKSSLPANLCSFLFATKSKKLSLATIIISCEEAEWEVEIIERGMRLLPDSAAAYYEWLRIASQYEVRRLQVHAARLVARLGRRPTPRAGARRRLIRQLLATHTPPGCRSMMSARALE